MFPSDMCPRPTPCYEYGSSICACIEPSLCCISLSQRYWWALALWRTREGVSVSQKSISYRCYPHYFTRSHPPYYSPFVLNKPPHTPVTSVLRVLPVLPLLSSPLHHVSLQQLYGAPSLRTTPTNQVSILFPWKRWVVGFKDKRESWQAFL
jgi:hypothetical protein